jgi:hypothetical protein
MDGCDGGFGYFHRRSSATWKAGSVNSLRYAWRSPVRTKPPFSFLPSLTQYFLRVQQRSFGSAAYFTKAALQRILD